MTLAVPRHQPADLVEFCRPEIGTNTGEKLGKFARRESRMCFCDYPLTNQNTSSFFIIPP